MPEEGGKVRLGFIPDEWFTFFYNKTGVTGPYMFGTGLVLYLLNKEIYVVTHEILHGAMIIGILVYAVKKYGPAFAAFADKEIDEYRQHVYGLKNDTVSALQQSIDAEKKEQWRLAGRHMLFDAKKENIGMQAETAYRERLHKVNAEVIKKLDYHVEVENVKRRVHQEHMVDWIQKNVIQSITPQQEKENIAQCIRDLKALSAARA